MTTEPSTDSDCAIAAAAPYKTRRFVNHKDGSDPEFWNASYFIPGITGRPRCLQECSSSTQGGSLSLRTNDAIDSNDDDYLFGKEDNRAWCSPSALRGEGLELDQHKSTEQKETSKPITVTEKKDDKRKSKQPEPSWKERERMGMRSLPNVLLSQKENATPKQINPHSRSDLRLVFGKPMPIEEELRELLKSMRDNR
jgi:hypothetical protein